MAFDSNGRSAVEAWIRPAAIEIPPFVRDIMGWTSDQCAQAQAPTHPHLIDERHVVAELYNMNNVPMAVWVNVFSIAPAAAQGKSARQNYIDAIRDWVTRDDASPYAL